MAPNTKWNDDQFDFQDEPAQKNNNKAKPNNALKNKLDDFQDILNEKPITTNKPISSVSSKLPVIATKPPVKGQIDEDQYMDEEVEDAPNVQVKRNPQKNSKIPQPEDYGEDFEDNYGEDFEEDDTAGKDSPKKNNGTSNQTNNIKAQQSQAPKGLPNSRLPSTSVQAAANPQTNSRKNIQLPPQPPATTKQINSKKDLPPQSRPNNLSLARPPQRTSQSKGSARSSPKQTKGTARASVPPQPPSTQHTNEVLKSFPEKEEDLNGMPIDKLVKLNEKVRLMIKKFNQELSEILERNMIHFRAKQGEKEDKTQDKIRVLEEQCKNGQTTLENMTRDFERLQGRQGEVKEEQYHLLLDKRIQEAQKNLKEVSKDITRLKHEIDNSGKKLSQKETQKKSSQQIHHLKTELIQARRDEEKAQEKLSKVEESTTDVSSRFTEVEYQIEQVSEKLSEKGLLQSDLNKDVVRKYQLAKKALQNAQKNRSKTEHLFKGRQSIVESMISQVRVQIQDIQGRIVAHENIIVAKYNDSLNLILKAKESAGLSLVQIDTYSKLEKMIQERKNQFNVDTEASRVDLDDRHSAYGRLENNKESRKNTKQNDDEDVAFVKPKFTKKKQQQDAQGERVWREEDRNPRIHDSQPIESRDRQQKMERHQTQPNIVPQEPKKPFSLKKPLGPQLSQNQHTMSSQLPSHQPVLLTAPPTIPIPEPKEEPVISVAPRMRKFGKKKQQDSEEIAGVTTNQQESESVPTSNMQSPHMNLNAKSPQSPPKSTHNQPSPVQQPVQVAEPEISIAPKRFNFRARGEKKDDGYMPSFDGKKDQEPAKEQQKAKPYAPPVPQSKPKEQFSIKAEPKAKEQYKPKFNFADEEPFKAPSHQSNTVQPSAPVQEKPRINLRLRDRKKQDDGGYAPTQIKAPVQEPLKPVIPANEPQAVNPYAPKDNDGYQREGRPRKIKAGGPSNGAQKQKINYFDAAEDLTSKIQQAAPSPPAVVKAPMKPTFTSDEPDLNQLLGLKKEKKNDFADLLDSEIKPTKRNNGRKQNDFFGGLDI